jgi:fatty-acyl-CoA synthase
MACTSLFELFNSKCSERESAPAFSWNNHTYDRKYFLNLIHFLVDHIQKQKNLSNDVIIYYGSNHPIALALPFVCSFLKVKYFAIPDSAPIEKVHALKNDFNISHIFSTEQNKYTNYYIEDIWTLFLNNQSAPRPPTVKENSNEFSICFLTSGSTNSPKLILLNETHILENIKASIAGHNLTENDSVLATLNICHSGGLCIQTLPAICAGALLILHKNFNLNDFAEISQKGIANITLLVPSFLRLIKMSSYWEKNILSKFRLIGIGSANLEPQLAEECLKKEIPLMSIYGLTEAGPFALSGIIKNTINGFVSIGKPALGIEVKLSDGDTGKFYLRGQAVTPFFFNGKEPMSLLDADGWLDTGDDGFFKDNNYYFTNRNSDIANIGGLKVNTLDVEKIICSIDGVVACAVFTRDHKVFNSVLVACIELNNTQLTRKKISAICKELLPRQMVPRNIYILEKLPKSSIGKVLKNELKKTYGKFK